MIDDDTPEVSETGRQIAFALRMAAWLEDNPGAWPVEKADFEARLREELGL